MTLVGAPSHLIMSHQAPIVDVDIRNDNECAREIYMFMLSDTLSAHAMDHNVIPPVAMREA